MLKQVKDFGKYVAIAGFKEVQLGGITHFVETVRKEKPSGVDVQFFDARLVATWQHLYFSALNALTAFKNRDNISNSLAMECLLYASAQRQIRKAMKILGVKTDLSQIAVLAIGEKTSSLKRTLSLVLSQIKGVRDDTVLKLSSEKSPIIRNFFGISEVELETIMNQGGVEKALRKLVIERVALLAVQH